MAGGGYRALLCRVCCQPPVKLVHNGGKSHEAQVIYVMSEEQEIAGQLMPSTAIFEDVLISKNQQEETNDLQSHQQQVS